MICFRQLREQPFHFVVLQRHVHLDGGMTRNRGRDPCPNLFQIQRLLLARELIDQFAREEQVLNMEKVRARIAASIACHAAIKVNMPLTQNKMEWLIAELAKTECPMSCPHGRPVVLRYSLKDIQKAFKRI